MERRIRCVVAKAIARFLRAAAGGGAVPRRDDGDGWRGRNEARRLRVEGTPRLNRSINERWTTRERLEKTLSGMREVRRPGEQEIFEIASLAQPNRTRQVMAFGNNGRGVKSRANKPGRRSRDPELPLSQCGHVYRHVLA